jgi:hypothetical protein
MSRRHWRDLARGEQIAVVALGTVQIGLAAVAWMDLARRPAETVRGRKQWWALAIGVNFVGPLAYLRFGRRL